MTKLALIGTIEVVPGRRKEVLHAALAHRERCLRDEPGTLQFEVLVPADNANNLVVYELYADAAALDAHNKGASMATMLGEVGASVAGFVGVPCTPAAEYRP